MTPKFYRLSALGVKCTFFFHDCIGPQVHLGGKIWGHQVQKIPIPYYMFLAYQIAILKNAFVSAGLFISYLHDQSFV